MSGFKEFFQCCNVMSISPQIIINMQQKQKSHSCTRGEKRSFIKRSVGKNPILDLSLRNTNKSTISTPKRAIQLSAKRISNHNRIISQQSFLDLTMNNCERVHHREAIDNTQQKLREESWENYQQMSIFANYNNLGKNQTENLNLLNNNEGIFGLYEPKHIYAATPTLGYNRRVVKRKYNQGGTPNENVSQQNVGQIVTTMKTILQTIEDRSSIPSMSQSQMYEMHQIPSKATIKSNICDKNILSPFTDKFQSMVIDGSRQSLRMANSQNILNLSINSKEQEMINEKNRLQMENTILERELKTLIEQQKFLKQQKLFEMNRFKQQIDNLRQAREVYDQKLLSCSLQMAQIKQIFNQYHHTKQIQRFF